MVGFRSGVACRVARSNAHAAIAVADGRRRLEQKFVREFRDASIVGARPSDRRTSTRSPARTSQFCRPLPPPSTSSNVHLPIAPPVTPRSRRAGLVQRRAPPPDPSRHRGLGDVHALVGGEALRVEPLECLRLGAIADPRAVDLSAYVDGFLEAPSGAARSLIEPSRFVRVHAPARSAERVWPRDRGGQVASTGGNSDGGVVPWS
jgi:hypothetical protein